MSIPDTDLGVTQAVREGLRIVMFGVPCPTCGHQAGKMTLAQAMEATGVSAATLSRFLNGKAISSDHLDTLYEWVLARLPNAPERVPA